MYPNNQILLPKDLPKHHAVGRVFYGWDGQVYYCDSYDPQNDFWMTNILDATERRAVSPRAINASFHSVWDSWKPGGPEDVVGRTFRMVDLRVPHDQFTAVVIEEKNCVGLDDLQILFFWAEDAEQFLKKVKQAAIKRAEKNAAASATSTATL